METGRVIHGRYLLQRLVKQTAFCIVHQGMDQRLQRSVAVKTVFAPQMVAYKKAVKMTANFSHPHIIGLYDLVIEPDSLSIVQEYVEGEAFDKLVQSQLSPYEVADMGWQMCLALMYAGSSSRRVCHGDLVPGAVMRDRQKVARLNNFALPTDMTYFQKWSSLGADGVPLLEMELPWGQQSEARKADDTRAIGLLLYQLVTGTQEPPADGRLRFSRGTPPELCEIIARAIVRQHPQNIANPELLYAQLKPLAETLEPAPPSPALTPTYQTEEPLVRQYSSVGASKGASTLPARDPERGSSRNLSSYSGKLPALETAQANASTTNPPLLMREMYEGESGSKRTSPALILLLLGLMAFALFFVFGYFLGHALIH